MAILVIGLLSIAVYDFFIELKLQPLSQKNLKEERIVLPQYKADTYRDIPMVQNYLEELRALIKSGKVCCL